MGGTGITHRIRGTRLTNCWARQQMDMPKIAEDLKALNIECVNASPGTALQLWPVVNLEDHVAGIADIAKVA